MTTRSNICVRMTDGTYRKIYCHYDGYPSHNGKMLREHYATQELAEKLVSLGDLSTLEESIECPEGHSFQSPIDGYTVAYHRDRGEKWDELKPREFRGRLLLLLNLSHDHKEYVYLWDGKQWLYAKGSVCDDPLKYDVITWEGDPNPPTKIEEKQPVPVYADPYPDAQF